MEMKLKHRLLSMVLSLLMVLSLIPATVFAADESGIVDSTDIVVRYFMGESSVDMEYAGTDIADAISEIAESAVGFADDGLTSIVVTLNNDVTATSTLTFANDVTFDLNGHTLTIATEGDGIVVNNATLTLANSGNTGKYVFECSARGSDGVYVNNTEDGTTSTLNIDSDVEIHVNPSVNSAVHALAKAGTAIVNINAGKIVATGSGKQFHAIHADQNSTINVNGGEFDLNVDFTSYSENNDVVGIAIYGADNKQENITVNINGGAFKVGGKNAFAQVVQVGMSNGYSENCKVNISGGEVVLNPTENGKGYVYATYKTSYATAEISGGKVFGNVTALVKPYITSADIQNDGLTISGGEFPTTSDVELDIEKYLAEGCTYDAGTGTVKSEFAAKIGDAKYETLDAAIAAVKDGETIVLSAGGYKLTGSSTAYKDKAFTIKADDNAAVSFDMSAAVALHGAKITFEGVTFNYGQEDYVGLQHTDTLVYNNCTINGKAFLYANSETFNNCKFAQTKEDYNLWTYGAKKVVFNGCTFDCSGKAVNVYIEDGNASSEAVSIEVNGVTVNSTKENKAFLNIKNSTQAYKVTFSGENTVNGLAVDSTTNSALYQVETTEITETSGNPVKVQEKADDGTLTTIFEVKVPSKAVAKIGETEYETLAEAIAAAEDGATVTLLADTTVANITIAKNITIDLNGKTVDTNSGAKAFTITAGIVTIKNGTVKSGTVVNGSNGGDGQTIYVNTAQGENVTLNLEDVIVIGAENQKSGVTDETVEDLKANGMYRNQTTAGTALYIYGKMSVGNTTVNVKNSTIVGGYGSATNGTQVKYISGGANMADGGDAITAIGDNVVLTITDGSTIKGGDSDLRNAGIAIELQSGTLTVDGATVTGGSCLKCDKGYGIAGNAVYVGSVAKNATIKNSTLTGGNGGYSYDGSGIEIRKNDNAPAKVVIEDSTVKSGNGENANKDYAGAIYFGGWDDSADVTFKGDNTLAGSNGKYGVVRGGISDGIKLDGNLTVAEGTLKNTAFTEVSAGSTIKSEGTSTVEASTIISLDENAAMNTTPSEDGTYSFGAAAAQVIDAYGNKISYTTFADALAAAEAGETVKLLSDVTADVTIDKNITLDLGGKTLTNTNAGKATITVANGTTATVKNGNVVGGTGHYNIAVGTAVNSTANLTLEDVTATAGNTGSSMIDNWGTLTINSGTYTGGLDTVKNEPNATLDITGGTFTLEKGTSKGFTGVVFNYGKLSISGGTFIQSHKSAPYGMAQVIHTDKSGSTAPSTVITGGTFKNLCTTSAAWTVRVTNAAAGSTKVSGGTFNKKVSDSYYAEGFISTKNSDGTYSVEGPYAAKIGSKYYATLADAVKAAVDGDKIILIANVELGEQIATGKAITIDGQGKYTIKATTKLVGTTGKSGMFYRTTSAQGTLTFLNVTLDGNGVSKIFLNEGGAGETVFDGVTSTNGGGISYGSGIHISGGGSHATIKNSTLTGSTGTMELNDDNYYAANDLWVGGNVYVTVENSTIGYVFVNSAPSATETNGVVHGQLTITGENTKITYLSGEEEDATKVDKFGNNGSLVKIEAGSVDTIFDKGSYAISGGTFKTEIKSEWCADGFIPTKNEDGTYGVKKYEPVEVWTGYIGTKVASYSSVAEAAANLGENKWIVIGADYTLTEDFTIPADVFLDIAKDATLTVAEGVTLTVAADAKRLGVRTGATLVNNGTIMVLGTSNTNGYVMVQDGATFDVKSLSLPDGYILGNNGNSYYAAKAIFEITYSDGSTQKTGELTGYLTDATRATLLKDISDFSYGFSTMNKLADNFVLDLGGHTWSGKNSAIVLSTSVPMTITNGTIMYVGPTTENAGALYTSADVTIDATAVIDGGAGYAVWTDGYGHTLTVNGTVKSDGSYAITSNGSENGGLIADCDIIVNAGAKIEASNGIGIYHPELGTVTINGGTITANTGIEMCAGNLVINDGTITSIGANVDATGSQNAILDGAAVSIINRNYPGGIPTAEIKGGTFKATVEGAQTIKAYDYTNNEVAEWTDAGEYVNVSGGTFSSIPSNMNALCADGYKPVKNADDTYTVSKIVLTVVLKSGTENAGTLTGGGKYTAEEVEAGITITATPVGGYTFIGWYDGETKITDSATYKIPNTTGTVTYTAKFVGNVNQKLTVKSEGASFAVSYVMNGTEGTWDYWFENDEYLKGTKFVITAQDVDRTTFLYWKNGEGRILTDSKTYEFTLGEDKEFVACYTNNVPDNVKYVIFRDLDNRVIRASVSKTDTIAVPSYNNYSGYKFVGWVDADGNVLAKAGATTIDISTLSGIITIYAKYEAAKTDLTVTVDGVKQDKTYSYSDIVTVVADAEKDGNAFTAWYIGDDIVSYDQTYSFRITRDVVLTAKYEGTVDKKPLVYMFMHDRAELDNGKQSIEINVSWSVPEGYQFSGAGFILTQDDNHVNDLTLENVDTYKFGHATTRLTTSSGLYMYTLTLGSTKGKNVHGVGYLTYINSETGDVITIYSSPITSAPISAEN